MPRRKHDVTGARGPDQGGAHTLGDQCFEERAPGGPRRRGVLVGEVEDFDAVVPVQAGDFSGELHRVAMSPTRPEASLPAVVALVRAAPGELHDDRAFAAPVAVPPVVDQLPPHAVLVEV